MYSFESPHRGNSNEYNQHTIILYKIENISTGTVAQCNREVAGSISGRVIPKTLKIVLAVLSLGAQH